MWCVARVTCLVIIMAGWQLLNVAGYLIEERRRCSVITLPHEDNVLNKFKTCSDEETVGLPIPQLLPQYPALLLSHGYIGYHICVLRVHASVVA